MNIIEKLPLPICGLILALISLGVLLQDISPYLKYLFGSIGTLFLSLVILKIILYPKKIKNDFKNPIITSSFGTFSMSLMLLSTYIIEITPNLAYSIWIIGITIHIMIMIYFTHHFIIHNFNISDVYPSYWIVYVGITMAAITSTAHQIEETGFIFFIIGLIAMTITLPLIIYRYIKYNDIPDMNKPLICIFTALFSILIVGYSNSTQHISNNFMIGMYLISCIFYIFAFLKLINYRNLDFYPSFSAFTFPFVISANATKQMMKNNLIPLTRIILYIESTIAILIVLYVLLKYLKFLKEK